MSGYPMIDALNAGHPLTPREKVAEIVRNGMNRLAASHAGARPVVSASKESDRVTDAILTALASGSGDHFGGVTDMIDHAELARLAEAAKAAGDWWSDDDVISHQEVAREDERFIYAMSPAAALALIAEIAALRGERDAYRTASDLEAKSSTEAERKLAEANLVIREISETAQITRVRHLARTFLSKEAERG